MDMHRFMTVVIHGIRIGIAPIVVVEMDKRDIYVDLESKKDLVEVTVAEGAGHLTVLKFLVLL